MQGGITFFRGTGASATAYLESDHHRADEYYLEEEGQLAERFVYGPDGSLVSTDFLDSQKYQQWVDWGDPDTGEVRGEPKGQARLRQSDGVVRDLPASPRFAEMTINCDKSLSVAAALDPRVSAALDAAQNEAAQAMSEYVASNAVTRVGERGNQRLIKVERFEAAAVVHKTSRAGDPHRHVHLQWNTRVFAEGKWRGLWTTPTLKQQAALRGIGESLIRSHEGLRTALAEAGFTYDPGTGKVIELEAQAELLSKRHNQVWANVSTIESGWRAEHPGQEPSPDDRRRFDFQAWALDRPKKQSKDREVSHAGWIEELRSAGLQVEGFTGGRTIPAKSLNDINRVRVAEEAIAKCESKASAWSLHDLQAAVAEQVVVSGVVADREAINAFITDTAAQAAQGSRSISDPRDGYIPDHVRHITSERVIAVENELRHRFAARAAAQPALSLDGAQFADTKLAPAQQRAAQIITSETRLGVIEGAAGSGKTTLLKEAKTVLDREGRQLVVLSPTLKGAQEASASLEAPAYGLHKLLYEHGFRWDEKNRFTRLKRGDTDPKTGRQYKGPGADYRLNPGTRVVVDEAGMLGQDTALALTQLSDQYKCGLVFMGDRAQLAAVGRGGVLDKASKIALDRADVDVVHRFTDKKYAELSLQLRNRENPAELFDKLYTSGHVRIHNSAEDGVQAMTERAAQIIYTGGTVALGTPTNEGAAQINRHMQKVMASVGRAREAKHEITGSDDIPLMHGDVIMTRNNDTKLGVANRETYTVKNTHSDGSITITTGTGAKESIRLPAEYVRQHVHLGYASTEYGEQGATETTGANLLTSASNPGGVYVGLTRGKEENTLHIAASSYEDAKNQFVAAMHRDTADTGLDKARQDFAREIDGLDLTTPPIPAAVPEKLTESASTTWQKQQSAQNRQDNAPEPSPEQAPEFDHELRAARQGSEQRRFERDVRTFDAKRERYEKQHSHTPEAWAPQYDKARDTHQETKRALSVVEANVQDRAEQDYRSGHVAAAEKVNAAYQSMEQANMFAKRSATREYEQAREQYQEAYGQIPDGKVPVEPAKERLDQVRAQALKTDSPELAKARAIEQNAGAKLEQVKAKEPRWITEERRPKPPTQSAPDQELAKDRAYKGRVTQAQRLKNEYRNDARAASSKHPSQAAQHGRGPER